MASTNTPSSSKSTKEFVWTNDEVELLLGVVNDYKTQKAAECIDWESIKSKYSDILALFVSKLPEDGAEAATNKDYPHKRDQIAQKTITSKIKAIRTKFRQAVDSGRKSGHGRVVLLFYEQCEKIWGGSPATEQLGRGVESGDLQEEENLPEFESTNNDLEKTVEPEDCNSSRQVLQQRRRLLDDKLSQYRQEKLKRKLPIDTQLLGCAKEDLEVKKKLIKTMEDMDQQYSDNMTKMAQSMEKLTESISDGFSVLKNFLTSQQHTYPQPHQSPYSFMPTFHPGPSDNPWPPTPRDE